MIFPSHEINILEDILTLPLDILSIIHSFSSEALFRCNLYNQLLVSNIKPLPSFFITSYIWNKVRRILFTWATLEIDNWELLGEKTALQWTLSIIKKT